MNTAYLKNNVVVRVAPEGWRPPPTLDYDSTQTGEGASVGYTWNGSGYDRPPEPPEVVNRQAIEREAEEAMQGLRQYRDLASPSAAQRRAFEKGVCRVLIVLIRLQLKQLDGTD